MFKVLSVLLTLSAIFSSFMFLIEAFSDHGLSSGQHASEPLAERLLASSLLGGVTALLFHGAYKSARASRPSPSFHGFPVLDKKDNQDRTK
jgi:hypothetical protein